MSEPQGEGPELPWMVLDLAEHRDRTIWTLLTRERDGQVRVVYSKDVTDDPRGQ